MNLGGCFPTILQKTPHVLYKNQLFSTQLDPASEADAVASQEPCRENTDELKLSSEDACR